MKQFPVSGMESPKTQYWMDTTAIEDKIVSLVEDRHYLTITMPPKFGKTHLLHQLQQRLQDQFYVLTLDFGAAEDAVYASEESFAAFVVQQVAASIRAAGCPSKLLTVWLDIGLRRYTLPGFPFFSLSKRIDHLCKAADRGIVLLADNVDHNTDSDCIPYFLSLLKANFEACQDEREASFQSVILMSISDIRLLREYSYFDSAADFDEDLRCAEETIAGMLREYEAEHRTGMDLEAVSREIRRLTGGYPYIVCWLCNWLDTEGQRDWTTSGVQAAGQAFLSSNDPLLQGITELIARNPSLKRTLYGILRCGLQLDFRPALPQIQMGTEYGLFIPDQDFYAAISSPLLETYCKRLLPKGSVAA